MKKMRLLSLIIGFLGLILIGLFGYYQYNVMPVDNSSDALIEVVIPSGMSTSNIAKTLKDKNLIRSDFFFKVYLKLNNVGNLKAATYNLSKNMSLDEIVNILVGGTIDNSDVINLTFKEGETIKDYATMIEENTNISASDFLTTVNDEAYLTTLINDYWFLTEDILNPDIYYSLEGYLAPDTYQFQKSNLTVDTIVRKLLDEEGKKLASYKETLESNNIHDIITLASMAELEGVTDEDRKLIVSVFNNRLALGMNLGSDVTTYYAFNEEMDQDLTSEMFNTYNPYNTRSSEMAGRLPVGPICNPSISAIIAALEPAESDYLYFVADKNRKVYFTKNMAEHEAKVQELKENGDWIW